MGKKIIYGNKVYSSYFAVVDKHVFHDKQISISLTTPPTFRGYNCNVLAPSSELLNAYKRDQITAEQYEQIYIRELSMLKPEEVYNMLKGKVICCWEKKGAFCHRHIVLNWLAENLGIHVIGGEL